MKHWAVSVAVGIACVASAAAQTPQLSREAKEQFLLNAKILKSERISVGVTSSQRATLSDNEFTHDAHIQTVDIFKPRKKTDKGIQINFRDSYKFNIAAYRLDKLLGLNMVPVSVEREVNGSPAAVTWWVDDILMTEKDRFLKNVAPKDPEAWNHQIYQARVFNQLVANTDPNLGNFLITADWKLWAIDFTRAFRTFKQLRDRSELVCIAPAFYDALKTVEDDSIRSELGGLLEDWEMEGLLGRRQRIIEIFDRMAEKQGRETVFCELRR